MTQGNGLERLLRELSAPRRNHYFYGKLMDVFHFEMEQTYVNHKRWLLNQRALGHGVLCGLGVSAQGGELCVDPGMAIDEYGREIIKPVRTCIDPWTIPDPCAEPGSALSKKTGHRVSLWICYKECLTDPMPVLVSEYADDRTPRLGHWWKPSRGCARSCVAAPPAPAVSPRVPVSCSPWSSCSPVGVSAASSSADSAGASTATRCCSTSSFVWPLAWTSAARSRGVR